MVSLENFNMNSVNLYIAIFTVIANFDLSLELNDKMQFDR